MEDILSEEEWRPVIGYEGLYEVSSTGGVRALDRLGLSKWGTPRRYAGGPKRVCINSKGYPYVQLTREGKRRTVPVHRLMGEAFLGAGPDDVVRHLNDVKDDNRLENLAIGTHSDNALDKVANGHHWNAEKTHCKHGHEFTPENTKVETGKDGRQHRACRACRKNASRRGVQKRSELRAERRQRRAVEDQAIARYE